MARRPLKRLAINSEIWAESGGTGGMFGGLWRRARLNIVSRELTAAEQKELDEALQGKRS